MTVVLGGYYGFGNAGDELILSTLVREYRRSHPGGRMVVLSHNPTATRQMHGVEAVNRWSWKEVTSALRGADRFVLGGGGLFQDRTSLRSLLYYAGLLFLAQRLSKSVALYSVGFETIQFWLGRAVLRRLLGHSRTMVHVRDGDSYKTLIEWGIPSDRVWRTSDTVFLMGILPRSARSKEDKKVMFVPRFPAPAEGLGLYRDLFREFRRTGARVQVALFHPEMEWPHWSAFQTTLPDPVPLFDWTHPSQLIEELSDSRAVISARFHGLVLAELAGVPCWGIGSQDKAGRFCRDWNRPFMDWEHTPDEISAGLLRLMAMSDPSRTAELDRAFAEARLSFEQVFFPLDGNS